ncbi:MAG: GspE/PulE family protein, partial [Dehalococcoidia bacterium]
KSNASDIHLVPNHDSAKILFRMNGELQQMLELPLPLHESMISQIKAEAGMDVSEDQRPQDGGFNLTVSERRVEFRVTSMGTTWGEMMVIRVLDQYGGLLSLESLGMESQSLQTWRSLLESPYGMLMVSGPTGSGKTTTLYASLAELTATRGNIMSVEDPIESRVNGVNQIQINRAAGIDFPSGLSSLMRLDPDVILVSEISDSETATAAMHAALSGHLVLASIQGNDAASSIVRLVELGIEPVLAATGVIGCLAQRLVRQVCPKCGVATEATRTEAIAFEQEMAEAVTEFMSGQGCDFCDNSGFAGQGGVIEVLSVDEAIRSQISERAGSAEVRETAIGNGMVAMRHAGLLMAQNGKTTMSEVLRKAFILG